jgi:hypothetical protein
LGVLWGCRGMTNDMWYHRERAKAFKSMSRAISESQYAILQFQDRLGQCGVDAQEGELLKKKVFEGLSVGRQEVLVRAVLESVKSVYLDDDGMTKGEMKESGRGT